MLSLGVHLKFLQDGVHCVIISTQMNDHSEAQQLQYKQPLKLLRLSVDFCKTGQGHYVLIHHAFLLQQVIKSNP